MDEMTRIALAHYERYPQMQMKDFLKLVYQNTFGPKHFSDSPSKADIAQYLEQELSEGSEESGSDLPEDLGFGYVRIPLQAIKTGKWTIDSLSAAFEQSMLAKEEQTLAESILLFREKVDLVLALVKKHKIKLSWEECVTAVEAYYHDGIRPISHSALFRETYLPHYRVIQSRFLPH